MAEDEAVAIGVRDGDAPSVPVGVARRNLTAAGADERADSLLPYGAAKVKHQQVFVGGARRGLAAWVRDQFQVPRRAWPSQHQQGVATLRLGAGR